VVHVERSPDWWAVDAEGKPAGWRGWVGVVDVRYGSRPKESTLEVVDTLDQLREKVPQELFDMVSRAARQPTVEELDI
jgi:EXLDI family protein